MFKLTENKTFFSWFKTYQKFFELLKIIIILTLILHYLEKFKKTIFETDFLNYVNQDVLSQYNNKSHSHSMIFNNKNLLSIKYNYKIYDKRLVIIHWRFNLEITNILIEILIDHKNLKHFMISKKLTRY